MTGFHPAVDAWFRTTFESATPPQSDGWASISSGNDTLIAAPTGSGKTLAAFLSAINDLVEQEISGTLGDGVQVVYISPLKALSNDISKNLQQPLQGIAQNLAKMGLNSQIRTAVRTGDTTQSERRRIVTNPPHILVTTPESLYIYLTTESGRSMLENCQTIIVDEIHAIANNKRGSHTSLTLERLERVAKDRPLRIGLSATQNPIERIASFLTNQPCTIVDSGHKREIDLAIEVTGSPLQPVMPAEHMAEIYDRLTHLIDEHETTVVFANTRRESERVAKNLCERLGETAVRSHHGALSKEKRLEAEQALKNGTIQAIVATASLELGIDIGSVDLVCQLGSNRSVATLLQRIGRSGHNRYATPKGRIFPLTRDELVECAAALDAIRRGELDELIIPEAPLDILAQQIVAMASEKEEWDVDEMYNLIISAQPFSALTRERFEEILATLTDGYATRRGRRSAYIYWDEVNQKVRPRKSARLTALTNGGAIPDRADYQVVLDPAEIVVGTLDEDFAIESMPGDIFQLGNTSWQIMRIESGKVRVIDAKGQPPTLPFWLGEAPSRSDHMSFAVSRLRTEVADRVTDADDLTDAIEYLEEEVGTGDASRQLAEYIAASKFALGEVPSQSCVAAERFFDEAGNTHLVVHSPFGGRVNRAWGLALRKRFCKTFNFELQAAANEDTLILSMGPTHSFPLDDVFSFLDRHTVRDVLIQAMLDSPMFETRWRWNMNRSLAVPRFRSGKKVPPPIQRMQSEDMLALVFPDQIACAENLAGDREVPDHPIIQQTIHDCLTEAMDVTHLEKILEDLEDGSLRFVAKDLKTPSPMAHQIINARPYAFLDDAPLEERRTMAIRTRNVLDLETMKNLATLDLDAIDRVREEAFPDFSTADELHDALVVSGFLTLDEMHRGAALSEVEAEPLLKTLVTNGRALLLERDERTTGIAIERVPQFRVVFDEPLCDDDAVPARYQEKNYSREDALKEIVRARLDILGPVTAEEIARSLGVQTYEVDVALLMLEGEGAIFRGSFTPDAGTEWCERRLLARIHRYTMGRLRREIQPLHRADFMRFLFSWQHLVDKKSGTEGLFAVITQNAGFPVAAASWETDVLPARVNNYDASWLDAICLSGRVGWGRLTGDGSTKQRAVRSSPIVILPRQEIDRWATPLKFDPEELSGNARRALTALEETGACFFSDITRESGLLPAQAEDALTELVASGVITSDSFTGLRALIMKAQVKRRSRRFKHGNAVSIENAGRWSVIARAEASEPDYEFLAMKLLQRYGIMFRKLAQREGVAWRELLYVYRRLEARGEIRGGRFVTGFVGEQFAMPDAVERARKIRRQKDPDEWLLVSGCDPLNLTGIVTEGERIASVATNLVLYRNGVPIGAFESGVFRALVEMDPEEQSRAREILRGRSAAPARYLGTRR